MAERRQEGVPLLQSGDMPQGQIARELGVSEAAVSQGRVKQVIDPEFGVAYPRKAISRLLHKMGWSVQKPDSRAMERARKN